MNLGKSLSVAMAMNEISPGELADKMECSRQYISQMKNSENWSGATIAKFSHHLDMVASEFIKLGE